MPKPREFKHLIVFLKSQVLATVIWIIGIIIVLSTCGLGLLMLVVLKLIIYTYHSTLAIQNMAIFSLWFQPSATVIWIILIIIVLSTCGLGLLMLVVLKLIIYTYPMSLTPPSAQAAVLSEPSLSIVVQSAPALVEVADWSSHLTQAEFGLIET
jgi:hypothetical protein